MKFGGGGGDQTFWILEVYTTNATTIKTNVINLAIKVTEVFKKSNFNGLREFKPECEELNLTEKH